MIRVKQLTLRGFDRELARRLEALAKKESISLNQAALKLMRRGAGLDPLPSETGRIGHALDHFFGTMSAEEAGALLEAIEPCSQVDEGFWN